MYSVPGTHYEVLGTDCPHCGRFAFLMNIAVLAAAVIFSSDTASRPFAIEVIDEATGRGVPLVELTTTSGVTYITDAAGLVAFDDPALMNQRVFFDVKSHGYEF